MMTVRQRFEFERRLLQVAIATAALVPLMGGLLGVLYGSAAFESSGAPSVGASHALDSHVRYLSGLLLGIGIAFGFLIPTIERQSILVRVLTAIVVTGGLARLYGAAVDGLPSGIMFFALGMELIVTPLLCLWQSRVARLCRSMPGVATARL